MLQFIYELYDPRTDIIGYLGITIDPNERYKQHLSMSDNNRKKNAWIGSMLAEGVKPGMRIREVIENDDERAFQQEKYWIRHYLEQGINLTNIEYADRKAESIIEPVYDIPEGIQVEAPPLTDWQVTVWRIVYGDSSEIGRKLEKAKVTIGHLHNLFEINNLLDNVQGETLLEQLSFLRAMLINTPQVRYFKQSQRFLYENDQGYFSFNTRELMAIVFPVGVD